MTTGLDTAQLAIYILLSVPIIYVLYKHGRTGFQGWVYFLAFTSLRIIGGALASKADKSGTPSVTATIISNIGLSPLILGLSGVLHEARRYRNTNLKPRSEWILVLLFDFFLLGGMALILAGSSSFKVTAMKVNSTDLTLVKIGIVIFLVGWVILSVWSLTSLLSSQATPDSGTFEAGSKLLYGILGALPFTLLRLINSALAILHPTESLNPLTGSLGLKLGLNFIPELIAILIMIGVGIWTRNVIPLTRRENRAGGGSSSEEVSKV